MLFNSLVFFVFLPLFLIAYFGTHGRLRLWVCLLGSYLFYGWWDWRFLGLVLLSTTMDYGIGLALERTENPAKRKALLTVTMVLNLGLLCFFKYLNFFVDSAYVLLAQLGVPPRAAPFHIILPIGISFYTFQTMSYTIDVYRRRIQAEPSFLRFATFVAFFPQLVAGPIIRASDILPQLKKDLSPRWDEVKSGLMLALMGYFKKVAIADSLAMVVDTRFAHPQAHTSLSLLIGAVLYAFQIYCDFSGYSDIAIGLARMMGFDFGKNFDRPYFSASFSEFWTRWHISLSSWLRDYLYIPLGGNRHGTAKTYRNLALTMLLGGLWHGANWTFVVWGALHGFYLVAQRLLGPGFGRLMAWAKVPQSVIRVGLTALVFALTCVAWVFFRAQSVHEALYILRRIAQLDNMSFSAVTERFWVLKALFLVGGLYLIEGLSFRMSIPEKLERRPAIAYAAGLALVWGIALLGTFSGTAFIYFQF